VAVGLSDRGAALRQAVRGDARTAQRRAGVDPALSRVAGTMRNEVAPDLSAQGA